MGRKKPKKRKKDEEEEDLSDSGESSSPCEEPKDDKDKYKPFQVPDYVRYYPVDGGKLDYIVYFESSDTGKALGDRDMMALANCLKRFNKGIKQLRRINKYKIGVVFERPGLANAALSNKTFLDSYKLKATIPAMATEVTGVIQHVPLDLSNEQIYSNISCSKNIVSVRRFMKRTFNNNIVEFQPLKTVSITFSCPSLPDSVDLNSWRFEVRPYIAPVKQCLRCLRLCCVWFQCLFCKIPKLTSAYPAYKSPLRPPHLLLLQGAIASGSISMCSIYQYLQHVDRAYKTGNGEVLARELSLRDSHVENRNLRSSDVAMLVMGKCVPPLDEIVVAHLQCLKSIYSRNYMEAYNQQSACVAGVIKLLQAVKEENWTLPLMYTVCLDLRLVAQKVEGVDLQNNGKILEKAAESLLACFRVCTADNRSSDTDTKKLGMLNLVNQLFKVYFRINKLHLCKPLIRAIDSSPFRDQFNLAQQITYKYFVGRKAMFDSDYRFADELLSFAFENCHRKSLKNKRLILTYLIPVKMLLGFMPSKDLLQKYDVMQFWELTTAVKAGNLRGIDQEMEKHEQFFIKAGIYLIVEKLKITAYRNLFRKVYLAENSHQIDIASFQAALTIMGHDDVDADETQCIVANLIYDGKIKGYISYQHKKVVVSKANAFPPLSSF